ncbi:tumor necrosis factor receptor superfamily member 21-like [Ylistrum balloti]|uniref:tumor necrosis factor receptor superfamily member 21-like n=1 Tax=Ylistrum balloti TaxID=509963 RepID=UPI0029059C71|nr:tumor necrosis factor receptor superfamily member 21-like [Ylistrum balloti]
MNLRRHETHKTRMFCSYIKIHQEKLSFCKKNRTSDYCHQCPIGSFQAFSVDSRTVRDSQEILKCRRLHIDCPPEAVPTLEDGIDCKCDTSRGYVGKDPMLCLKYPKCPPGKGFDIENGTCSVCPVGTFNPERSYLSCKSHTNCTQNNTETVLFGNATMDTVCGKRSTITSTVTTTDIVPQAVVAHKENGWQTNIKESEGTEDIQLKNPLGKDSIDVERYKNSELIIVIVVMSIVIITLTLLLSVVIRKRRKETPTNDKSVSAMKVYDEKLLNRGDDKPDHAKISLTGDEEPGTLTVYPGINKVPLEPSAPSLTPSIDI